MHFFAAFETHCVDAYTILFLLFYRGNSSHHKFYTSSFKKCIDIVCLIASRVHTSHIKYGSYMSMSAVYINYEAAFTWLKIFAHIEK